MFVYQFVYQIAKKWLCYAICTMVWDQDAAGSNPVTSTTMNSVFILNTEFFVFLVTI